MAKPLVNGRAYDFTDLKISILTAEIVGCTEISYNQEQPKENVFGTGIWPEARGHGARDTTGSIGLSMNEIEALREVAPLGNLLDLPPFDIIVIFGNVQNPQVHTVKNVEFTTDGVGASTGDQSINYVLDFVASHVNYR